MDTQYFEDRLPAVYNRKPNWKHTANPNTDPNPNPIPNWSTYSLLQSGLLTPAE